jgi:hypothetical protein
MIADSCICCRFFLPRVTEAEAFQKTGGMCRRYAPTGPTVSPSGASWQIFPPMSADQWCGDFRPIDGPVVGRGKMAA